MEQAASLFHNSEAAYLNKYRRNMRVIGFLALLLCSCNRGNDPDFDVYGDFDLVVNLIDCDTVTSRLMYPQGVALLDSLAFVNERDSDPMIVCYDMSTRTHREFLNMGRGPGETTNLLRISACGDSVIQASVDPETLFIYNKTDTLPSGIMALNELQAFSTISRIGPETLIFCGKDLKDVKSNYTRFCIYDMHTDSVHCFGKYPAKDKDIKEIPVEDFSRLLAYQGDIVVKPDNSKAAVNYFYAVGFDIIDIEAGAVSKSKFYQYPRIALTYIPEIGVNAIRRVPESYRGFLDSACSDSYIYFLYSGKTFEEDDYDSGRHILKYDWDGNPVCRYILDNEVDSFAIDKHEDYIYATKSDDETGYLVRYKM